MTVADNLRVLLAQEECHTMPCCFDALSAKLIQQEGYPLTFMSGFAASASRIGAPDLGLMSYSEVAAKIDKPRAVRAVASACGKNRIGVLIPCHRVLRGDGGLGGYRWGLERKRALLEAERRSVTRE